MVRQLVSPKRAATGGLLAVAVLSLACQSSKQIASQAPPALPVVAVAPPAVNPAAPGFDQAGSDYEAIEIADQVMERLGGRANWDRTRHLTWRFFGRRLHVWDKLTGDLRFEEGGLVVLMNLHERRGRAWRDGEEISDPDSLHERLLATYKKWINDSYWVVMPYKLKDTGVTLKYVGQGMTEEGIPADILQLTFSGVGVTPQNKYDIYVDVHDRLVRQWSYYGDAADDEPAFTRPWSNWQQYGTIWLADDHGLHRHSGVAVLEDLPRSVYEDPAPFELSAYPGATGGD